MAVQYPTLPGSPTRAHYKRLLWRAGFSASKAQIDHYVSKGLPGAVSELLNPFTSSVLVGPEPTVDNRRLDPLNEWGHDAVWWIDRMVRSRNQLVERMTLSLHDLFATSNDGVGNTRHMLRQNGLLRRYALGSFSTLLREITHDPAMLLWLNGADSSKWEPNENYAREVMELFCLGADPGLEAATYGLWRASASYSQDDIHEAARALTGWRYDWNKSQNGTPAERANPTYYSTTVHDTGLKTIFGQTGRFTWEDVCRLVVQHPNHAPYLCYTLWSYFIPTPPPLGALQMMVRNYRSNSYSLKTVLGVILRHPDFYASLDAPGLVKPPIVFVAGGLRMLRRYITHRDWAWILAGMGQQPFYPPNVSGWQQGPAFLNTNTVRAYWTAADYLLVNTVSDPGTQTPDVAVSAAVKAVASPWVSADGRGKLQAYAQGFEADHAPLDAHERLERQRVIRGLLLAGPDGLLH